MWGLLQTSVGLHLLNLNVTSVLGHTKGNLAPEPKGHPENPVKDTPDDLGGEFVTVNRVQLYTGTQRKARVTYASNWGPKVVGIKRGAWKRTVDTVV